MILCWVAFIAILGFRWHAGHGLDIPGREWYQGFGFVCGFGLIPGFSAEGAYRQEMIAK